MRKTKLYFKEEKTTDTFQLINVETGEVVDTRTVTKSRIRSWGQDGDFCMVFPPLISTILDLSKTEVIILLYLGISAPPNTNMASITKVQYDEMGSLLKYAEGTMRNAVMTMKKKNVLIARGSGQYIINPYLLWRGNKELRQKAISALLLESNNGMQKRLLKKK